MTTVDKGTELGISGISVLCANLQLSNTLSFGDNVTLLCRYLNRKKHGQTESPQSLRREYSCLAM